MIDLVAVLESASGVLFGHLVQRREQRVRFEALITEISAVRTELTRQNADTRRVLEQVMAILGSIDGFSFTDKELVLVEREDGGGPGSMIADLDDQIERCRQADGSHGVSGGRERTFIAEVQRELRKRRSAE